MPNPDDSVFPELRDKLARLIWKRRDIERKARDSNVPLHEIDFTGSAINVWQDILYYCESHSIQEQLVQVLRRGFPRNTELDGLCQRWIGNLPPAPQSQPLPAPQPPSSISPPVDRPVPPKSPWKKILLLLILSAILVGAGILAWLIIGSPRNTLGLKFVPVTIPGGKPVLFCVWKTRVKDFEAFVKDTGYDATKDMVSVNASGEVVKVVNTSWKSPGFAQTGEHPVCGVSFEDAKAFCEWLSKKDRRKYRLPTDHEWSCAVGIGNRENADESPKDKNKKIEDYPWGTEWPPLKVVGNYAGQEFKGAPGLPASSSVIPNYSDGFIYTSPVGSFPANPLGLFDLGGNLWEWCDSDFDGTGNSKTLRGASWDNGDREATLSSYRNSNVPAYRYSRFGFRVVMEDSVP